MRAFHAAELRLSHGRLAVGEELAGPAGRVHVLGTTRGNVLATRVVIELLLRELTVRRLMLAQRDHCWLLEVR